MLLHMNARLVACCSASWRVAPRTLVQYCTMSPRAMVEYVHALRVELRLSCHWSQDWCMLGSSCFALTHQYSYGHDAWPCSLHCFCSLHRCSLG